MNNALLDILACPICKGKLHYDRAKQELVCNYDELAFPVRDEVPIMLEDQARRLERDG